MIAEGCFVPALILTEALKLTDCNIVSLVKSVNNLSVLAKVLYEIIENYTAVVRRAPEFPEG